MWIVRGSSVLNPIRSINLDISGIDNVPLTLQKYDMIMSTDDNWCHDHILDGYGSKECTWISTFQWITESDWINDSSCDSDKNESKDYQYSSLADTYM